MVVHESTDSSLASIHNLKLAPKKYVVIKNHVREIIEESINAPKVKRSKRNDQATEEKASPNNHTSIRKSKRKHTNDQEKSEVSSEISESDLQELKRVYIECKNVLRKIESKYGHVLNLSNEIEGQNVDTCKCSLNRKKILFDEDGQQTSIDSELVNHICPNRLKYSECNTDNYKLEIEYDEPATLPNSLIDLGNILKEPNINNRLRRSVINKIKELKHDYINELRFDKQLLVSQLKSNAESLLEFKGTNLSTILGYPS